MNVHSEYRGNPSSGGGRWPFQHFVSISSVFPNRDIIMSKYTILLKPAFLSSPLAFQDGYEPVLPCELKLPKGHKIQFNSSNSFLNTCRYRCLSMSVHTMIWGGLSSNSSQKFVCYFFFDHAWNNYGVLKRRNHYLYLALLISYHLKNVLNRWKLHNLLLFRLTHYDHLT